MRWFDWQICGIVFALSSAAHAVEALAVQPEVIGTTPVALGYNLGHFAENSNAADWFRYSGADSARLFIARRDLEKSDDTHPWGDGVVDRASFFARCKLLRANASNPTVALSHEFIDWSTFDKRLSESHGYLLETLRDRGIDVLATITAGQPVQANDWAGRWELWQHYYAAAFLMSSKFNVRRYSMFNEPNHGNKLKEDEWLDLLLVCSDAIQSAIQDVNKRHNLNLQPEIFAPNTAGGASKYNDKSEGRWGKTSIENRHRRLDGSIDPTWKNFHVYNYQKYTHRQFDEDQRSGFLTDYDSLRSWIDADMKDEPQLPLSLTEFNTQTAANYDRSDDTPDNPSESSSLGASLAGLSARGMQQMYLFKFGQTAWRSKFGVKKNGTHFVQNSSPYNYGGATRTAEAYRLFIKAARGAKPIQRVKTSAGASPGMNNGLWSLATRDEPSGMSYLFLANRDERTIPLDIDFSGIGVPSGNPYFIEQVDGKQFGAVVVQGELDAGKTGTVKMPPLSVWLVSVPIGTAVTIRRDAVADTQLRDGAKSMTGGGGALDFLMVRSDQSKNPRHVALIRIPVPSSGSSLSRKVLLEMDVASSLKDTLAQAHVYGIEENNWSEDTYTWKQADAFLKPKVPQGNRIEYNVVHRHGKSAQMLGQIATDSTSMNRLAVDVTDFAHSRKDGFATFLIVQEHRWDISLPALEKGDTQPAHLRIGSRERQGGQPPRLVAFVSGRSPAIEGHPQSSHTKNPRR